MTKAVWHVGGWLGLLLAVQAAAAPPTGEGKRMKCTMEETARFPVAADRLAFGPTGSTRWAAGNGTSVTSFDGDTQGETRAVAWRVGLFVPKDGSLPPTMATPPFRRTLNPRAVEYELTSAAHAPDGKAVALVGYRRPSRGPRSRGRAPAAGPSHRVVLEDAQSGALVQDIWQGAGPVDQVALTAQHVVVARNEIWVHPRADKAPGVALEFHQFAVRVLSPSIDGRRLLSTDANGQAAVWDLTHGRLLQSWSAHSGDARGAAWHPNRPLVFTGGDDGKVIAWHLTEGAAVAIHVWTPTPGTKVTALAISPDGETVAVATRGPQPTVARFRLTCD